MFVALIIVASVGVFVLRTLPGFSFSPFHTTTVVVTVIVEDMDGYSVYTFSSRQITRPRFTCLVYIDRDVLAAGHRFTAVSPCHGLT